MRRASLSFGQSWACWAVVKKFKVSELDGGVVDAVIAMAWADRVTFEAIEKRFGLTEPQVIEVMRSSLKRRSFNLWRARVTGRVTKHRKLFKRRGAAYVDG